ncbi:MAG: MtrB/PioB family outer membrane beta-barrel protein, partial [Nitrospirae bacterium]|nr:MtrB/PioB family outer membrane beta-barrel protein [Nitrospirota bacterium]
MKRLFLIAIIILLIVNVAFSQEKTENQEPLFTPAEGPEKKEDILYTPAGQAETPEEILFTPVVQIEKPEKLYTLTAEIISEFQSINLDKESSKAQEYRILADGLYIRDFSLYYGSQTQEFGGKIERVFPLSDLIADGYGDLSYRRYGLLDVTFGLSKFPHDYANDAKTIFNLENPYTYRVQQSPTTAVPVNVSTQRDSYNLLFKFSPGDRLIISSALTMEERKGRRPFTVESLTDTTQYPFINPTAIIEIAEPVDYTTTAIDLGLEYMDGTIDLQLNNNLRIFVNNLRDEVIWDNPYKDAAYGRAKVADDHTVHTLSFKPSVKFTDRIRLINTLSYSKVTSSMDLVPVTTTPGVGGEFLRDVIDSDVRNLLFSSILSTRPFADVSLNMKYRYYAHKNDTPKTEIDETPPYVMLDGSATLYPRIPRYMSYNTKTLGLDGAWVITERLSLDAGIENEDISRDEREVGEENKKKVFLTLRSRLSDKLSGMLGYIYDRRRGDYDQTYYKAIYDPNSNVDQHPLLRAFDLSER